MSDFDLVLSGIVVLPERILDPGWVAVRGEAIAAVGVGVPPAGRERHDLGRALILPGVIDAQTHSMTQKGQEDFVWTTRSGAAGGVTTLVDMPYDEGSVVNSAAAVHAKIAHAEAQARVDFALYGTIDPAEGVVRIPEMVEAGVCAFKFSTFGTHPTRFPRIPPPLLAECFAEVAKTGLTAGVHNEDDESVRAGIERTKAAGITDWRAHGLSRPPLTELLAMAQIYETGAATGCPAHVVHCSLARGYDLAASYRAQGFEATAECLIHYLTLAEEEDMPRLGGRGKANPPIRSAAEREGLWRQVAAGNVWLVSTDHVSWSLDRKSHADMFDNASGVPGLESILPAFVAGAVARGVPLTRAAQLTAQNPARHFRIDHVKGALTPGRDADIAVLTPTPYTVDAATTGNSVVGWSPYDGLTFPYKVAATYARGRLVYDGTTVLAEPGTGRFVRPPRTRVLAGAQAGGAA